MAPPCKTILLTADTFSHSSAKWWNWRVASDIALQAAEIIKARERIARVIARESGQPLERVLEDIEHDLWMSASEAVEYGLVSRIITRREELLHIDDR